MRGVLLPAAGDLRAPALPAHADLRRLPPQGDGGGQQVSALQDQDRREEADLLVIFILL